LIRAGEFPPGKMIHGKRLWRESEIDAWIERIWTSDAHGEEGVTAGELSAHNPPPDPVPDPPANPGPAEPQQPSSVYWAIPYLCERYSITRTTLWRWTREKTFPAPISLGSSGSLSRWHADDVLAWEARLRGK
ncbi:MAG: hypothetical protein WD942_00155, partial [Dehalococcoidia bacterium]